MIFELPSAVYYQYDNYQGNGQSALLQAVRQSSSEDLSELTNRRGMARLSRFAFSDDITFEVVPAFTNSAGSFTFPDSNHGGRWRTTNPRPEIQAIRDRNNLCNGNLIRLCRMMRAWKDKWDVPMGRTSDRHTGLSVH